ncbi:MAG TPA: EAL domain-containing protein, partial [Xanthobacteraceae bacterium]|nr:EAL domain-containing protein [Xanthobacteraceae bacterium]
VDAIISLAHSLGLKVIAEGVETRQQMDLLSKLRCDEIQGYLLSPPLDARSLASFLTDYRR